MCQVGYILSQPARADQFSAQKFCLSQSTISSTKHIRWKETLQESHHTEYSWTVRTFSYLFAERISQHPPPNRNMPLSSSSSSSVPYTFQSFFAATFFLSLIGIIYIHNILCRFVVFRIILPPPPTIPPIATRMLSSLAPRKKELQVKPFIFQFIRMETGNGSIAGRSMAHKCPTLVQKSPAYGTVLRRRWQ